jgi:hypothetical protein
MKEQVNYLRTGYNVLVWDWCEAAGFQTVGFIYADRFCFQDTVDF